MKPDEKRPASQPGQEPAQAPMQHGKKAPEQERLTVEITRYQPLISIITDTRRMARVALLITLITCLVFTGLLIITLAIKRIYPYNDIQTNALGAMTIRDEDKEVTYWLFNTAELWANSGIAVQKGDILTIRASGLSHTSLHHLYDNAKTNCKLNDPWSGTEGIVKKESLRDQLRAQWCLIPQQPQDALIMQVIPNGKVKAGQGFIDNSYLTGDYHAKGEAERKNDLYFIGKERTDLYINQDGILHFAVNDIVLTPEVIYEITKDHLLRMTSETGRGEALIQRFERESRKYPCDTLVERNKAFFKAMGADENLRDVYKKKNAEFYNFGPAPGPDGKKGPNTVCENEMSYYNEAGYYTAWYDDNVGSFLIVVERKKN